MTCPSLTCWVGQIPTTAAVRDRPAAPRRDAGRAVGGDGGLVQLFTSGTTGTPKGVPIPLQRGLLRGYQEFGLDVRQEDVFWNAADPGWAYGLYFAILAPMASGIRSILLQGGFSADRTWQVFKEFQVSNFAAAPTVYRSLAAAAAGARTSSAGRPRPESRSPRM